MKIICPQCNTTYNVPDGRIPEKGAVASCKKCGNKIVIKPSTIAQPIPIVDSSAAPAYEPPPSISKEAEESTAQPIFLDYPELQGFSFGIFAFEEILSPNKKGGYKNRKNTNKVKILKAVHNMVEKMVKDGEKVMRIGEGIAYYPVELILGNGVLTMIYNKYTIVCTNQRLLFININYRGTHPTHYLFQVTYEEIDKVKRGLLGTNLIIRRVKGKRRIFSGIKRYTSKELNDFIVEMKNSVPPKEHPQELLENLCPSCFATLNKGLIKCPFCQADFKEPKKAFIRSLLLPGLGDIYLGHRALGSLEMIGSLIIWAVVISLILSGERANQITAVIFLVFYNGLDGLLALHMAKKGYMRATH
jgi:predicted Zn finger-like uncharacterized protein